ncbi:MAG: hypothetical protein HY865_24225 [Chloroflexi bacterium]|nr:hypothetical protein [Chloroflexota bacterium]
MSENPVNHGTSEDRVHFPVWRTLINLVIAVLSAALAPFPVWLIIIPLWLVLGAFSYYAPPGILQALAEAAVITASAVLYLGGAAVLGVGVQFVVFGIPTTILGWRLGRIIPRSSIIAGFLIGCLPYLLILPFDQSFGPNYPSTSQEILRVLGTTLVMGALGAFEGFLFWLVWRVLSKGSAPTKRTPDLG